MFHQMNFDSNKELKMIQYPGLVNNVEKMMKTFGGSTRISQAFCGETKRLELRFHHKNPFNKAINGEHNASTGLLLSIKVRRSKSREQPQYRVEILGHCNSAFIFDSLCDFQYLPIIKNPTWNGSGFILNSLVPHSVTDDKFFSNFEANLFCLPHFFARSESVPYNIFRNDLQEDGQIEVLGVMQKSTYDSRDVVTFNMIDQLPLRPDQQVVKRMKVKYVSDEQLEKVKKLFDECPIWTRIALLYESGISNDKLKCIIPSLAYYFSTGPWRTMYVRFGYDPRKDFNSRYYQKFDFRLRFRSGVAEYVDKRSVAKSRKQDKSEDNYNFMQDIDYPYFEENKLPRSRQCIVRYCDIRMRKVQEMLDKIPSPMTGATCNEHTGWLPVGFDGQMRQILSNVIKDLMRKHCRKDSIQSEFSENADSEDNVLEVESDVSDSLTENITDILGNDILEDV